MLLLCLLSCSGILPDSAIIDSSVREEEIFHNAWNVQKQGSAVAGRSLDPVRTRTYGEGTFSLSGQWGDSISTWQCQSVIAPLVGIERIDSNSRFSPLLQMREVWTRMTWSKAHRVAIAMGRWNVEPGAGMSYHPSRILPWDALETTTPEDPEVRNPVGFEALLDVGAGTRASIQAWPRLDSSATLSAFHARQRPTIRLEQTFRLPHENTVRLEAGGGQFLSFGGSLEWSHSAWFLSAEAALRNDHPRPRFVQNPDGSWSIESNDDTFQPSGCVQIQRDFSVPALGQMRLSLEWVEALEGYAHRAWIRLGSVESLTWNVGINALFLGPTEGIQAQVDAHANISTRLTLECALTTLAWSRPKSLLRHYPPSNQGRLGVRWCW